MTGMRFEQDEGTVVRSLSRTVVWPRWKGGTQFLNNLLRVTHLGKCFIDSIVKASRSPSIMAEQVERNIRAELPKRVDELRMGYVIDIAVENDPMDGVRLGQPKCLLCRDGAQAVVSSGLN